MRSMLHHYEMLAASEHPNGNINAYTPELGYDKRNILES